MFSESVPPGSGALVTAFASGRPGRGQHHVLVHHPQRWDGVAASAVDAGQRAVLLGCLAVLGLRLDVAGVAHQPLARCTIPVHVPVLSQTYRHAIRMIDAFSTPAAAAAARRAHVNVDRARVQRASMV
jgi:hypothetical protein